MTVVAPDSSRTGSRVLLVTTLASFLGFLDITIVNIAFPSISRSFATASPSHLSWVLNSYNVLFAAFLLPCGAIADRLGRTRALTYGLLLFVLASLACAAAPSLNGLIAARSLQALAAALLIPSSLAVLLGETTRPMRPKAIALWAAAGAVAAGIGPSLGGLLVDAGSWRYVFLINVPVALGILVGVRTLPSPPGVRERRPDLLGGLAISIALGALALGIAKGEEWGWTSIADLSCYAVCAAMLTLFVLRSRGARGPMVPLRLFLDRERSCANFASVVFATAFYAGILGNVLFLTSVWHYSILKAGLAISPAPLSSAVVGASVGRFVSRIGTRSLAFCGSLIYAGGMASLVARAGSTPDYLGIWLPAALLMGCGIGLVFPALGASAAASLRDADFATGSALNTVARQLGAVLGTALVFAILHQGLTVASVSPYRHVWIFSLGVGVASAVIALFLPAAPPLLASPREQASAW